MDKLVSQNGENAVNKFHGKSQTWVLLLLPGVLTQRQNEVRSYTKKYDEAINYVDLWRANNILHVRPFRAQININITSTPRIKPVMCNRNPNKRKHKPLSFFRSFVTASTK